MFKVAHTSSRANPRKFLLKWTANFASLIGCSDQAENFCKQDRIVVASNLFALLKIIRSSAKSK